MCYVKWIRFFLQDQSTRVRVENENIRYQRFEAETPQVSMISPLIFLLFINDILDGLAPGVDASFFADDLAIWVTERAKKKQQKALDVNSKWWEERRLKDIVVKCEAVFSSMAPQKTMWLPKLFYEDDERPFNPIPTFLGVNFDQTFSFRSHFQALQKPLDKRLSVLRCLEGRNWGMKKEKLRAVYVAYTSSATDYCAAAYLPAMPTTILKKLQILQNSAARVITGCCRDTPVKLLNAEVNLTPITVIAQTKAACAYSKSLRLPTDNPASDPVKSCVRRRLKSQPPCTETVKETLDNHHLTNLPRFPFPEQQHSSMGSYQQNHHEQSTSHEMLQTRPSQNSEYSSN